MPPDQDKHSKTEAPSQQRLKKSREQGQVARSQDLSSTSTLVAGLILFGTFMPRMVTGINQFFRTIVFDFDYQIVTVENYSQVMFFTLGTFALLFAPVLLSTWLITLMLSTAQVGLSFSLKPLEPNLGKLNPLKGFKQLFSMQKTVTTGMALIKMVVIAFIASSVLTNEKNTMVLLHLGDINFVLAKSQSMVWELIMKSAVTLLILGAADYAYQRWQFYEDQKMTKQEVKDESKQQEGNPQVKSKIKSIQRAASQKKRGLKANVQTADVIVTNPFHIAVAIKYDRESGANAPIVVAKGARLLAERIKEFGREGNIEIIQNIPLARALYKRCYVDYEIPADLYVAVAEILAIVFKKRKTTFM